MLYEIYFNKGVQRGGFNVVDITASTAFPHPFSPQSFCTGPMVKALGRLSVDSQEQDGERKAWEGVKWFTLLCPKAALP